MPRRVPLPQTLTTRPFSVEEARALDIRPGRLRGADLVRPHHGVRALAAREPGPTELADVLRICDDFVPVLGSHRAFSHITAARLWRAPLPRHGREVLHVGSLAPAVATRRIGVAGHQLAAGTEVTTRYGMPVVGPAVVFTQLAPTLPLAELVVLGDHLVHVPALVDPYDIQPYLSLDELVHHVAAWRGRGGRNAREAIALVRTGSESRPETLLRLLLRRAGLPEPELNPELRGIRRRWRHRADLVYRERRVIVEYDGDQHRTDTRQYELDIRRFDDFTEDGWRVIRVRKHGLFIDPAETVDRVRTALEVGGTHP